VSCDACLRCTQWIAPSSQGIEHPDRILNVSGTVNQRADSGAWFQDRNYFVDFF
jgi:hypothetical protein